VSKVEAPLGVMSPRAGERWWEGVVVRMRRKVEGRAEGGEKSRRVSIVDDLSWVCGPAAEAVAGGAAS